MKTKQLIQSISTALALLTVPTLGMAQAYPTKPVRVVIPFPPQLRWPT
jgi:tripartite-type tricarboxylate transporter receptor subunit TctC